MGVGFVLSFRRGGDNTRGWRASSSITTVSPSAPHPLIQSRIEKKNPASKQAGVGMAVSAIVSRRA